MKRFFVVAALLVSASFVGTTPAFAFDVSIDDALCPIEAVGDAEIDSWAASLVDAKGRMTDSQADILRASVKTCSEKLGWSQPDTISALEFNLAIIAGAAIGDRLTSDGIDAIGYEVVLENRSAEDLLQILEDPENSAALSDLTEKLIADFGEELTDEITSSIATYIAFMAQSQFSAMKLMGLAD